MLIPLNKHPEHSGMIVDSVFKFSNSMPVASKPRRESHDVDMKAFDNIMADHDAHSHDQLVSKAFRRFSANSAELHIDASTEDGSPFKYKEDFSPS